MMKKIEIYTDGACSGNPGVGGWGAILISEGRQKEISGWEELTTNNRMELFSVIAALRMLKGEGYNVTIYSDSAYVCNAFLQSWVDNWQKNNFRTARKEPVKNQDLWQELITFTQKQQIHFIKVKGHADNILNNRCDELATNAIKQFKQAYTK